MTLGTHVAFASILYRGGATLFGYQPNWISWLLAGVPVPRSGAGQLAANSGKRVVH